MNEIFRRRADGDGLAGILAYSDEPLVSSDIVQSPYSAVFDAGLTSVAGGTQVNVVAWYDDEWGYSSRLVDVAQRVVEPVGLVAGATGGELCCEATRWGVSSERGTRLSRPRRGA